MSELSVAVVRAKCQGFQACMKIAPSAFSLDEEKRARFTGHNEASDEELLKAARCCPYKAVVIMNEATQEQLHPKPCKTFA